ncbi:AF4/FMR2 family member 4 [Cyclospora cayetanensis]|uniref:AF4/FMR2 family member 4 n=1 Tax=Cyclospora cayetanensis TaxID=88456 RepID=A0A6P6RPC6_9EIME|nr:AF4/FMR2 family member 4 [Cyclospora cayetanensis]
MEGPALAVVAAQTTVVAGTTESPQQQQPNPGVQQHQAQRKGLEQGEQQPDQEEELGQDQREEEQQEQQQPGECRSSKPEWRVKYRCGGALHYRTFSAQLYGSEGAHALALWFRQRVALESFVPTDTQISEYAAILRGEASRSEACSPCHEAKLAQGDSATSRQEPTAAPTMEAVETPSYQHAPAARSGVDAKEDGAWGLKGRRLPPSRSSTSPERASPSSLGGCPTALSSAVVAAAAAAAAAAATAAAAETAAAATPRFKAAVGPRADLWGHAPLELESPFWRAAFNGKADSKNCPRVGVKQEQLQAAAAVARAASGEDASASCCAPAAAGVAAAAKAGATDVPHLLTAHSSAAAPPPKAAAADTVLRLTAAGAAAELPAAAPVLGPPADTATAGPMAEASTAACAQTGIAAAPASPTSSCEPSTGAAEALADAGAVAPASATLRPRTLPLLLPLLSRRSLLGVGAAPSLQQLQHGTGDAGSPAGASSSEGLQTPRVESGAAADAAHRQDQVRLERLPHDQQSLLQQEQEQGQQQLRRSSRPPRPASSADAVSSGLTISSPRIHAGNNNASYHAEKQEWRARYYVGPKRCMRTFSAKLYGFERARERAHSFIRYIQLHGRLPAAWGARGESGEGAAASSHPSADGSKKPSRHELQQVQPLQQHLGDQAAAEQQRAGKRRRMDAAASPCAASSENRSKEQQGAVKGQRQLLLHPGEQQLLMQQQEHRQLLQLLAQHKSAAATQDYTRDWAECEAGVSSDGSGLSPLQQQQGCSSSDSCCPSDSNSSSSKYDRGSLSKVRSQGSRRGSLYHPPSTRNTTALQGSIGEHCGNSSEAGLLAELLSDCAAQAVGSLRRKRQEQQDQQQDQPSERQEAKPAAAAAAAAAAGAGAAAAAEAAAPPCGLCEGLGCPSCSVGLLRLPGPLPLNGKGAPRGPLRGALLMALGGAPASLESDIATILNLPATRAGAADAEAAADGSSPRRRLARRRPLDPIRAVCAGLLTSASTQCSALMPFQKSVVAAAAEAQQARVTQQQQQQQAHDPAAATHGGVASGAAAPSIVLPPELLLYMQQAIGLVAAAAAVSRSSLSAAIPDLQQQHQEEPPQGLAETLLWERIIESCKGTLAACKVSIDAEQQQQQQQQQQLQLAGGESELAANPGLLRTVSLSSVVTSLVYTNFITLLQLASLNQQEQKPQQPLQQRQQQQQQQNQHQDSQSQQEQQRQDPRHQPHQQRPNQKQDIWDLHEVLQKFIGVFVAALQQQQPGGGSSLSGANSLPHFEQQQQQQQTDETLGSLHAIPLPPHSTSAVAGSTPGASPTAKIPHALSETSPVAKLGGEPLAPSETLVTHEPAAATETLKG